MSKVKSDDYDKVLEMSRAIYCVMMKHTRLQDNSITRHDCSCGMYFPSILAHVDHVSEEIAKRISNQ